MRMFLRYKHGVSLWSNDSEGVYWGKYVGKVKDVNPNGDFFQRKLMLFF